IISRILFFVIGNLILSCGISVYLRLNIAMNPFDQFLKTVNDYLIPDMKKANYVYLGVPFIIALLFGIYNKSIQGIGIGTLIMLLFNGSFIKLFNKKVPIPDNILTPRKYI
ncbi:MAG: sugar permease, partial [Fusobacterium varium]